MSNIKESLNNLLDLDGALGCAVVDASSGMMLGSAGSGGDLEIAAAGNTEVVRAIMKTNKALGVIDEIEDILITLGKQYHILRLLPQKPGLFLYYALDHAKSNLALARRQAQDVGKALTL
ncbi:hypothetical protein [Paraherbaspirillum soli]|uniref:Roadblock/LC7 domain-containing protein n=1 Tax=Paraherbaspirillum soli TaxID=631222 RepID=A0ABW0M541_9BURK